MAPSDAAAHTPTLKIIASNSTEKSLTEVFDHDPQETETSLLGEEMTGSSLAYKSVILTTITYKRHVGQKYLFKIAEMSIHCPTNSLQKFKSLFCLHIRNGSDLDIHKLGKLSS